MHLYQGIWLKVEIKHLYCKGLNLFVSPIVLDTAQMYNKGETL